MARKAKSELTSEEIAAATAADAEKLAALIAQKRAAGLTLEQATEVAKAQIEHDAALES